MKVLFLSWNFPPVLGGIEYVVEHLYKGLKKLGHSVSAITSHCDDVEEDSNVYRCKKAGLKSYVIYSFFASFKFCLKERPDVILCGSIVTAPAAFVSSLIFRIPYLLLMHGSDILYGGKLYQFCVRFLVKHASRLAANSENTKRLLIAAGCKESRIDVIYPGVCSELYEEEPPTGCEEIFKQVKGKKIILSVGRLIKRKGVLEFVENVMPELVKRYPDVAYLVVGEDATKSLAHKDRLKDKIQAKIDELNLNNNVFLLGKVSNNDLTKLYYHCDIFTLPCLDVPGDVEGFGIVFSEAALGGAASLATKIGGIPEAVLDGKTGLLVDVEDYPAMIDAAEKLLKDDELRCSLAGAGAQRAKDELSWSVITKEYETSMFESLKSSDKQKKPFNFLFKTLIGILLIAGALKIAYPLWVNHYGTINADSYTYTTFARSIADGNFNFRGAMWDFIGANSVTGEVHPGIVWNTHILKDGTIACTVACGYPLFLALMFILGGTCLMLHANLLLLYASLVACFLCIKEIYKNGVNGSIFAGLSTLFVVLLNPDTFNQFSYPWREALFYTLILFGLFAVIKLINGGKIFWVILAGFLLGYSCSVKEANIVYSLAIGFAVIIEKKFWHRKDKLMVVSLAIISFLVGVAPLLIQNFQGTGNPFVSLQTIRATAEFSKEGYGQGMNPGNSHDTIRNYIGLYKNIKFFSFPLLVIAAIGVVVAFFRNFGGRAIFFCTALHMVLYLQWGNADFRHMFFMNYFYAFYLIYGLFVIAELSAKIAAKRYRHEVVSVFGCMLLLGYVLKADPYEVKPALLNYKNMQDLCEEIDNSIPDPENSIVLVNRLFMEQLGAHTQLNIIRYHDLQRLMNP
ncbi:MAG: glycosyltransferase, partial [Kiritimatiellae bacterium]|nr:glycosyltransferase [Kiritimatiellia bacterium]